MSKNEIAKLVRFEKGQLIDTDEDGNLSIKAVGFTRADGARCDTQQEELVGSIGGNREGVTHTAEYSHQEERLRTTR